MTSQPGPNAPTWSELTSVNHENAWKVLTRLDRGDLRTLFARALRNPSSYGAWSANFDLIEYFTDKSYIPGNPQQDFLTGSFNIKLGF